MNVALILISIYADYETISAGLMHDVLEDCDCTEEEMEAQFGRNITKLVQGVTKLSKIHFSTENEYLIDYYKKIIVGMSEDVRVIIIKLADRLHNMRTLWAIPEDRQKVKAHEALDILAPIAHHLGIHKIKSELEDLSLRYLKPDVFYDIVEKLNTTKIERDRTVFEMQNEVSDLLTEHHIPFEIKGRSKSIYSIYNKLNKGKKFSDIDGNAGAFAFIFSNINPNNGLECRHLAHDLALLNGSDDSTYKMTGVPVVRAKFLDLVLSNVDKTIFLGSVLVWFFLLFFLSSSSGITSIFCFRFPGRLSRAPALTKLSSVLRFTSLLLKRSIKSSRAR